MNIPFIATAMQYTFIIVANLQVIWLCVRNWWTEIVSCTSHFLNPYTKSTKLFSALFFFNQAITQEIRTYVCMYMGDGAYTSVHKKQKNLNYIIHIRQFQGPLLFVSLVVFQDEVKANTLTLLGIQVNASGTRSKTSSKTGKPTGTKPVGAFWFLTH